MCSRITTLLLGGALLPVMALAQKSTYPQGYFRNPVAIPISLAGNFGECRPGHFHMGIDIKTEGRENLPVYAAAEGFISRIKLEPGGFGHALYVQHPNGYTTLYAHLNNFKADVQAFARAQQYADEKWEQDITLPPGKFPVKKGEQIAWSGNTGGSTAPHLHFEIRDTENEHPLNPQLFGFAIKDTRPPVPTQVALYNYSSGTIYQQEPAKYAIRKVGNSYATTKDTITVASDAIGIGVVADDFMDGSTNTLAFYSADIYLDDVLQQRIALNDIGYDETRYLNAYADYRMKKRGNPWIQLLFRLPNNQLKRLYSQPDGSKGILKIGDKSLYKVRIRLTDAYSNGTNIQFVLKAASPARPAACKENMGDGKSAFDYGMARYSLDADALYAPACATYTTAPDSKSLSARHKINDAAIPVHTYFPVSLKADKPLSFTQRNKVAMVCSDGKSENGSAAKADQGWYTARFRTFGEFRLVLDTVPPVIKPSAAASTWNKFKRISFTAKDGLTSVKSFRGELDGKWIIFEQHGSSWFYEIDSRCTSGQHTLVVTARDENDNSVAQRYTFTR